MDFLYPISGLDCMRTRKFHPLCFFILMTAALFLASCGKQPDQKPQKAEIGKPAPDFKLKDTKGNTWELSKLRGKVVFVNFWATWCPPCRAEMPSMQTLYQSMPQDKFVMLAILSNDEPLRAEALATKIGATFPILQDPGSPIATAYGITGVPETYIVDTEGILRQKFIGPRPWDSQGAKDMLNLYLPR